MSGLLSTYTYLNQVEEALHFLGIEYEIKQISKFMRYYYY